MAGYDHRYDSWDDASYHSSDDDVWAAYNDRYDSWDDASEDDRWCEVGSPVFNEVTTDTWKGKLDFDRACTGAEQRCWLCTELTPWNQVMNGLAFELVELRPGKLRLRPIQLGTHQATVAAEASFLVSWLLQHHKCIDELKFARSVYSGFPQYETPFPIRLRPAESSDSRRAVRGLEVIEKDEILSLLVSLECLQYIQYRYYELEGLDAVDGLEKLKLQLDVVKPKFAAELAKLLRRNASSIKKVEIPYVKLPRQINRALQCLLSCESLTCCRMPTMKSVARLMLSTDFKELSIAQIASTKQMSAIANELKSNTSLTKLSVCMKDKTCSPEPVFTALQVNTTLRELRVTDCHIRGECEEALSLLLQKNTGLRLLHIGDAYIAESSLLVLAAALTKNATLESLHLSSNRLSVNGIAELCKVLRINKTLKKLQFGGNIDPETSRVALARQLAQDNCYSRVELPWTEPDLPGLTAALTSSLSGIEKLDLPNLLFLSVAGVKQLFNALASNKCVRELRISTWRDPGGKGRAICEMLKVNQYIECLDLTIERGDCKFVGEVLHALAENAGITEMRLSIDKILKLETATELSYFLAHNETATKFLFSFKGALSPEFVKEFSRGMLQNKTIVKLRLPQNVFHGSLLFPVNEAVRRNRGALNRAVDFVVSPSLDRQCAEGFELFSGKPCLLKHVKKVTGKAEPEALLAIAAAEHYLRDKYLLITGIVRHSVKCHPAEGTQVDALNGDCWHAIVRHLKVADVLI